MNKLILIISIYIFNFNYISAQNFSHGTFIDISDTCHTIFFDGKHYVRRVNCYDIGTKIDFFDANDPNNEMGNCGDTLTDIRIEKFKERTNEFQVTARTKEGKICDVITVVPFDSFLIITPLKRKPGILDHYTDNHIMVKKDLINNFKIPKTKDLELLIDERAKDKISYIVFDQKYIYNKLDSFLNMIYVPESGLVKTSISATPLILAYNSIKASVIINGEKIKIPVLYEKKLGKGTVYIKKEERAAYIKSNKDIFFHEKYFLRLSRYNPGRNFINDTFNEKIDGQVLDIELISIEKYINE